MNYYVYVWHDNLKPVYVGKGKTNRAAAHLESKPWAVGRKLSCDIYPFPSEGAALYAEAIAIRLIGTRHQSQSGGCLHNKVIPSIPSTPGDSTEVDALVRELVHKYNYESRFILEGLNEYSRIPGHGNGHISGIVGANLKYLVSAGLLTREAAEQSIWFGVFV